MKRDDETENWVFDSGKTRYAFSENLGIEPPNDFNKGWEINYGYDGQFWHASELKADCIYPDPDKRLSRSDLYDLIDHQIERWQEFKQWLSVQPGESNG